ncbi:major facilitator superfamily domain-containing protein [Cunninghamella echinulata]|nr:major facilitator superfamily domain-containing protein [Cunninghamella echinulata]
MEDNNRTVAEGVKKISLYTKIWTKWEKWILFSSLILFSWALNWEGNLTLVMSNYITDDLKSSSLLSLLSTISYILQTVLFPTYSKVSDMTGRKNVYIIGIVFYLVALAVMATAKNYDTYLGGQVIYAFGYTACFIMGPIMIGDLTDVVNRGLFQGLYNLPSLINIFVSTVVADSLGTARWRLGMWINFALVGGGILPLITILWVLQRRVQQSQLYQDYKQDQALNQPPKPTYTFMGRLKWIMEEFDIIGCLLLVGGLCMVLLPLVLATSRWGGWQSATTIGTLVGGVVSWILFALYEWKLSKHPIFPWTKWPNRTPIFGILVLSTVTLISSTNWLYFPKYLMLSRKIQYGEAVLLDRGYNVGYVVLQVVAGYLMKRTRKWRPFVWIGIALMILGIGLMIPARLPGSSNAFVVISQTIAGAGSGMLDIPILVAIQSSVPHEDLAIVTALMQVGGSICASIGSTVAGAIWNSLLPIQLAQHVPGEYDPVAILASTDYAIGLPEEQYHGVVEAYGQVQRILSITAVSFAALAFFFSLPMKSFGLEDRKDEDKNEVQTNEYDEKTEHSNDLKL